MRKIGAEGTSNLHPCSPSMTSLPSDLLRLWEENNNASVLTISCQLLPVHHSLTWQLSAKNSTNISILLHLLLVLQSEPSPRPHLPPPQLSLLQLSQPSSMTPLYIFPHGCTRVTQGLQGPECLVSMSDGCWKDRTREPQTAQHRQHTWLLLIPGKWGHLDSRSGSSVLTLERKFYPFFLPTGLWLFRVRLFH